MQKKLPVIIIIMILGLLAACNPTPVTGGAVSGSPEARFSESQTQPSGSRTTIEAGLFSPSPTAVPDRTKTSVPNTATPSVTPTPVNPGILAGAGDIGECGLESDDQTAQQLSKIIAEYPDAVVVTFGDNAYEAGTEFEFERCYDHSWGQFKDRTRPSVGNHEYQTAGASGYFNYFGENAGKSGLGYYSYELAGWQVIVLNSNCGNVSCDSESGQVEWLRNELESWAATGGDQDGTRCTLAYMHHPRWSSGLAGDIYWIGAFWDALYEYGAEIALGGHDHEYERFAPQDPDGNLDPDNGIRQFVVGTGGGYLRPFGEVQPNSETRITGVHGIIKLTLWPDGYEWQFINADGEVLDAGTGTCH